MANKFIQKNGWGSLFKNDYKKEEKHPEYRGTITLQDGTKQALAAWVNETKEGKSFLSIHISDAYVQKETDSSVNNKEDNKVNLPF
jgi:uncharacterized protein (DUF736 family)